jgi:CheY-like chemotaxis protein
MLTTEIPHEQQTLKRLAVLVADDVVDIQDLASRWLTPRGFCVVGASTGHDALRLARQEHFDLIVADVLMPDGDGLDIIMELKCGAEPPPILAISGGGRYMNATACIQLANGLGADGVLLKPFNEAQFLVAVERILGNDIV